MFADVALHAMAWTLLRVWAPMRTHAILLRGGAWLPEIPTPNEARAVAHALGAHGTCLSGSLAIAARAPAADVVIGVAPRTHAPLLAHAWIEMDGVAIDPAEVRAGEVGRLRGRRSRNTGSTGRAPG